MNSEHVTLKEFGKEFREVTSMWGDTSFQYLVANELAKKMVVILHGVTGNKLDMVVVGKEYVKRGYAVYAPDLPGHGAAAPIETHSFHELGDWLRDFIASLQRAPDILIGNSFASAICYDFASQGYLPEKTHLILACPTPDIAWSSRMLRAAARLFPSRLSLFLYNSRLGIDIRVKYLSRSTSSSARKWLYESEYHKMTFMNDSQVATRLALLLETHNPYVKESLSMAVQRRTTIVVGQKDNVMTRRSLSILRALLPNVRIVFVPHAGHILHFEAFKELGSVPDNSMKLYEKNTPARKM